MKENCDPTRRHTAEMQKNYALNIIRQEAESKWRRFSNWVGRAFATLAPHCVWCSAGEHPERVSPTTPGAAGWKPALQFYLEPAEAVAIGSAAIAHWPEWHAFPLRRHPRARPGRSAGRKAPAIQGVTKRRQSSARVWQLV